MTIDSKKVTNYYTLWNSIHYDIDKKVFIHFTWWSVKMKIIEKGWLWELVPHWCTCLMRRQPLTYPLILHHGPNAFPKYFRFHNRIELMPVYLLTWIMAARLYAHIKLKLMVVCPAFMNFMAYINTRWPGTTIASKTLAVLAFNPRNNIQNIIYIYLKK